MYLPILLLENRVDYLRNWFQQEYPGNRPEVFDQLLQLDPSRKKIYLQWLLKLFLNGKFRLEDSARAQEALALFDQNKSRLAQKDINQYPSVQDLLIQVRQFREQDTRSGKQVKRDEAERIRKQIRVIYDGPEGKILVPQTEAASCYLGRGTEWCTAATTSKNWFDQYSQKGPLYVILPADGRKFQLHFETEQYMDENDKSVELYALVRTYSFVRDHLDWTNSPKMAYLYARDVIRGRFPEGEPTIATNSEYGFYYACDVIRDRFPEGEPAIATNSEYAFYYARDVIRGKFPEGEPAIAEDPNWAYLYAHSVIRDRFPEGEPAIVKSPKLAYVYAMHVIRGRFPEGEPAIATDSQWAYLYAMHVIRGRFPEAEPVIAKNPQWAHDYDELFGTDLRNK